MAATRRFRPVVLSHTLTDALDKLTAGIRKDTGPCLLPVSISTIVEAIPSPEEEEDELVLKHACSDLPNDVTVTVTDDDDWLVSALLDAGTVTVGAPV